VNRRGNLDIWTRVALRYPIAYSRYVGATYYKDISGSVVKTHKVLDGYRVVDTIEAYLREKHSISNKKKHIKEYANKFRLSSTSHCIKAGRIDMAREHLKNCHPRRFLIRKLYL